MDLSSSVIRIIVLALPGILSALLYWRLRGRAGRKDWEEFLEIGAFSLLIYSVYGAGIRLLNWLVLSRFGILILPPKALEALIDDKLPIPWIEISEAAAIGIVIAVLAAYADKYNLIGRIGFRIGASTRLRNTELWDIFLGQPKMGWVYVRDHKLNLVYFGWLFQYSDADKVRELVLKDVKVYEENKCLYYSPQMYISRDMHDLTIEVAPDAPTNTPNNSLEETQMSEKKEQGPAIKILNPPQTDVPGDGQKANQNPNPQTARPSAEPVSPKPRNDDKK